MEFFEETSFEGARSQGALTEDALGVFHAFRKSGRGAIRAAPLKPHGQKQERRNDRVTCDGESAYWPEWLRCVKTSSSEWPVRLVAVPQPLGNVTGLVYRSEAGQVCRCAWIWISPMLESVTFKLKL